MLNAERQALNSEYVDSKMDGADAAILAAMIKTTSSDLRDWSHYPAASRMVPVSPATLRCAAWPTSSMPKMPKLLRCAKTRRALTSWNHPLPGWSGWTRRAGSVAPI